MLLRRLGAGGPLVPAVGLGCMGMSEFYGAADEAESIATIHRALDLGLTFFDTADMYGRGRNEELLGRALRGQRHLAFIATKFGIVRGDDPAARHVDGRPEYVRAACDASLRRLGIDTIDLYYQHRVDQRVAIEETVGAMSRLVEAGKVRYLGLSEAGPETLRRAHRVHPIAALQTEYSLFTRDPEDHLLPTVIELGIAFVAYSPLGRGILTASIRSRDDLASDDYRRTTPRFAGENFSRNLTLVETIEKMARARGCTPSQLALLWVLAQSDNIFAIPGTRRVAHLEQNYASLQVTPSMADLKALSAAFPPAAAFGERYPAPMMSLLNG